MDEKRRRRLTALWLVFSLVMTYVTFADGFTADLGTLLSVLAILFGFGLAYVYHANPRGVLSFGEGESSD